MNIGSKISELRKSKNLSQGVAFPKSSTDKNLVNLSYYEEEEI